MAKRPISTRVECHEEVRPIRRIKLLLHTTEGVVPYLTPYNLDKLFAADDRILIGLAVRDTCVVPVYPKNQNRPRGYTFSSSTSVDAYLRKFTRVIVPSFDLLDDELNRDKDRASGFIVTDNHVHIWTPNGRIKLSPELYQQAADGLASHVILPLYDMMPSTSISGVRRLQALSRTQKWLTHWVANKAETGDSKTWIPLLTDSNETNVKEQLENVAPMMQSGTVNGAALIGWKHIQGEDQAKQIILSSHAQLKPLRLDLAVISAGSLRQVILAACYGCSIVGSDLASQLAQSHKALIVDLSGWRVPAESSSTVKRPRIDCARYRLDRDGCMNLLPPSKSVRDHPWYSDESSLLRGCSCYTCKTHSRAYIYHLVCAKELSAEMLLMIHNLHHLLQILKEIEFAVALDQADTFFDFTCDQLNNGMIPLDML